MSRIVIQAYDFAAHAGYAHMRALGASLSLRNPASSHCTRMPRLAQQSGRGDGAPQPFTAKG
jgi:hypothetical protein